MSSKAPTSPGRPPEAGRPGISILINGQQYFSPSPTTGAELRRLGGIPDENQLFLERPGPQPDELIHLDRTYELKPGSHFYDLPRGTVGDDREAQIAYAVARLPEATSFTTPEGSAIRWQFEARPPWAPPSIRLTFVVPPPYPAQAPSGFAASPTVTLATGVPSGSGRRRLGDEDLVHFCWSPRGAINYRQSDGLWRYAKFCEARFTLEQ